MSSSISLILIFFYLRAKIIFENNKGHYRLHCMFFWRLKGQALFPFTPSLVSPLSILRLPLIRQERVKGQRLLNSSWIDSLSQLNTLLPLGQSLRYKESLQPWLSLYGPRSLGFGPATKKCRRMQWKVRGNKRHSLPHSKNADKGQGQKCLRHNWQHIVRKKKTLKCNKHKPTENTFIMRPHQCILIVNNKHII